MIYKYHDRIKNLKICLYCDKPLEKGIENKRGICRVCHHKYNIKTKLSDFYVWRKNIKEKKKRP